MIKIRVWLGGDDFGNVVSLFHFLVVVVGGNSVCALNVFVFSVEKVDLVLRKLLVCSSDILVLVHFHLFGAVKTVNT